MNFRIPVLVRGRVGADVEAAHNLIKRLNPSLCEEWFKVAWHLREGCTIATKREALAKAVNVSGILLTSWWLLPCFRTGRHCLA